MKYLVTIIGLLFTSLSFSQNHNIDGAITTNEAKLKDFKISITVDSAEEVKSTFNVGDFKDILNDVDSNEVLSFEMVCHGASITKGSKTSLRYKVDGNSNDIKGFLKRVKKVRKAAIKYYNNK